jgi:small acid-soluble spore protein H (minor)
MDRSRATEIVSLPEMVNVTYNGSPIYIEAVNPTKDAASIHYLDQPHNSKEVSLTQLVETKQY